MLPELFDTKITDDCAEQSNQRIHQGDIFPDRITQETSASEGG